MANNQALFAYEDRYHRVFSAGALHWNDPKTNQHLAQILPRLHPGSNCIEFGCGEGYQARFIASKGHSVTAIDISHSAIAKAKKELPSHLNIRFVVGDVTDGDTLNLPPESFHFAWNISCLHMMADKEDRNAHLELVKRILLPEGLLFSQNGLDLDDVQPGSDAEAKEIGRMKELRKKPSGYLLERNIQTASGYRKLMLPLCPRCKMLSLDGYTKELVAHGFKVIFAKREGGFNTQYDAVILARRL